MKERLNMLFGSKMGKAIYENAVHIIKEYSMDKMLSRGVLVGFSGGPDSVMLLLFLLKYAETGNVGKILAVHVNHMIRGEEACRDESFSKDFCEKLGVEFCSARRDVPTIAKDRSESIEETARNVRYSVFEDILQGRNDVSSIAVAHNSTDNFETVLLNMMRGAGIKGMAGIPPVRDNIARPLLYSSKKDIMLALTSLDIPFVIDSTNLETEYRRNFIRNEIIPKFSKLSDAPERMVTRSSQNLRSDADFIDVEAKKILNNITNGILPVSIIHDLHPALFSRVISCFCLSGGATSVEHTHINEIYDLISRSENFSLSLPGAVSFVCRKGKCCISKISDKALVFDQKISIGENYIAPLDIYVYLSFAPIDNISSNVYKISIKTSVDFDIIKGDIRIRNKKDGDSYVYGGMTRKLKKLFNDKGIAPDLRSKIPIFYDDNGIFYVKDFCVRDGGDKKTKKRLYIAIAEKQA